MSNVHPRPSILHPWDNIFASCSLTSFILHPRMILYPMCSHITPMVIFCVWYTPHHPSSTPGMILCLMCSQFWTVGFCCHNALSHMGTIGSIMSSMDLGLRLPVCLCHHEFVTNPTLSVLIPSIYAWLRFFMITDVILSHHILQLLRMITLWRQW